MAKQIIDEKVVYWIDGQGLKVPLKHVSIEAQKRDKFVEEMTDSAQRLQTLIIAYKADMQKRLAEYLEEVAENYGEDWAGNAKIRNFSQDKQVELKQALRLTFDETLSVAKAKVDKCIARWAKGSSSEIVALVNQAFAVDRKGQVDVKAMLKLTDLAIEDPTWVEAMEIVKKSITVESTKQYMNFHLKDSDGKFTPIVLQFSAL